MALNQVVHLPGSGTSLLEKEQRKTFETNVIQQQLAKFVTALFMDEFSELSGDNVKFYVEAARRGVGYFLYSLFENIRQKDLRIGGITQRRKLSVLSKTFSIEVDKWDEGKEFIEDVIKDFGDKISNFFTDIIEGNLQGIKTFEINYKLKNGKLYIDTIRGISNSLNLYNTRTCEYSILNPTGVNVNDLRNWAIQEMYDNLKVEDMPKQEVHPLKLLRVFSLDGDNENALVNGIVIAFAFAFYFKIYNMKDLQIFIEKWASPTKKIGYDNLNPATKTQSENIAKNEKVHGTIIYPKGTIEIDLLNDNNKGTAADIFLKSIEYLDTEMTTRVLGEADTTNKLSKQGSYAAMKVKSYVSGDITVGDLKLITSTFGEIVKRLVDVNFPNPPEYPVIKFVELKSLEDKKLQSDILKNVSDAGFEPTEKEVASIFDYETVTKKAAAIKPEGPPKPEGKVKASRDFVDDYVNEMHEGIYSEN